MEMTGIWVDKLWDRLASVKLTMVILVALLLLAIPGTVILQYNISNVDPGVQYGYNFWQFGKFMQLFTAYHSFWYVALFALLSLNLIACSVNRWPQMLRLAVAKPVRWSLETFNRQPKELVHDWKSSKNKEELQSLLLNAAQSPWATRPQLLQDSENEFQIFWQTGRWSRIANYLVHTSLLFIFAGAIISSLNGFEGAANIPSGEAVDTLIVFKEGKWSGLKHAPGGLINEKLLGFRLRAKDFRVKFYDNYPGRPESFITRLQVLKDGVPIKEKSITVNDPLEYNGIRFYQASYGRLGDFEIQMRVFKNVYPYRQQQFMKFRLGEPVDVPQYQDRLVALQAIKDFQGLGPAVQFQRVKAKSSSSMTEAKDEVVGNPFWVFKRAQGGDFINTPADYGIIIDEVEELFFTGLQIAYDPGAPVYWFGSFGLLLGTFYALLVTHRKYYLNFKNGEMRFAASIHRIPFGFEKTVAKKAAVFRQLTET